MWFRVWSSLSTVCFLDLQIAVEDQELFQLEMLVKQLQSSSSDSACTTIAEADLCHKRGDARLPAVVAKGSSQSASEDNRKDGKQPTGIQLRAIAAICG